MRHFVHRFELKHQEILNTVSVTLERHSNTKHIEMMKSTISSNSLNRFIADQSDVELSRHFADNLTQINSYVLGITQTTQKTSSEFLRYWKQLEERSTQYQVARTKKVR